VFAAGSGRPPSGLDKAGGVSIKDLPVFRTETGLGDPKVVWKAPPTALDADHHLPTFADMLREKDESRRSLAIEGFLDLVELCPADRVLTILPSLVPALKGGSQLVFVM
jgi:Parkin co-regulated protein